MTNNTIKHLGIVENIQGSHLSVRIVQTSACAACSAKGHCSSADSKDKIIDIIDTAASSYQVGEKVMVVGETSMGMMAVGLAFVLPFVLLIFSLFRSIACAYSIQAFSVVPISCIFSKFSISFVFN